MLVSPVLVVAALLSSPSIPNLPRTASEKAAKGRVSDFFEYDALRARVKTLYEEGHEAALKDCNAENKAATEKPIWMVKLEAAKPTSLEIGTEPPVCHTDVKVLKCKLKGLSTCEDGKPVRCRINLAKNDQRAVEITLDVNAFRYAPKKRFTVFFQFPTNPDPDKLIFDNRALLHAVSSSRLATLDHGLVIKECVELKMRTSIIALLSKERIAKYDADANRKDALDDLEDEETDHEKSKEKIAAIDEELESATADAEAEKRKTKATKKKAEAAEKKATAAEARAVKAEAEKRMRNVVVENEVRLQTVWTLSALRALFARVLFPLAANSSAPTLHQECRAQVLLLSRLRFQQGDGAPYLPPIQRMFAMRIFVEIAISGTRVLSAVAPSEVSDCKKGVPPVLIRTGEHS